MDTRVFIQSASKPYTAFSPPPVMLHIKFDQDWPTGLRDIQVREIQNFLPVLVTCKFDDDSIKNEWEAWRQHFPIFDDDSIKNERASMETPFSHYKSMGMFFRRSRAANSVVSGPIWPKFELVRDFMHVVVTCKYKKDRIKSNRAKVEAPFSPL